MVNPVKPSTSKPVDNKYYTVSYTENGQKHSMKVEKGIQIFGTEIAPNSAGKTNFKTKGQADVALPLTMSTSQLAMLKAFAQADKKPELTAEDVKIMYQKENQGILDGYINARTPAGVKSSNNAPTYNYSNTVGINVTDQKTHKSFGLTVSTPSAENNPPAG